MSGCKRRIQRSDGNKCNEAWYDVTEEDQDAMLKATTWNAADNGYFRGGGFSSRFLTQAEMPATMIRLNLVKNLGPMLQIAEGWTVKLPDEVTDVLWKRTDYTMAMYMVRTESNRRGCIQDCLRCNEQLGELTRCNFLRTCRC